MIQRVRIVAGFDVVGFLLLLPAHKVAFLFTEVADCVLGWARITLRKLSSSFHKIAVSSCHRALYEVAFGEIASLVSSVFLLLTT